MDFSVAYVGNQPVLSLGEDGHRAAGSREHIMLSNELARGFPERLLEAVELGRLPETDGDLRLENFGLILRIA